MPSLMLRAVWDEGVQVPGVLDVGFVAPALLSAPPPTAQFQETPKATVAVRIRGMHTIKFHCMI